MAPAKKSNKATLPQVKNPYSVKRALITAPINPASAYIHKIDTAQTKAKGIYVSWATKPNGLEAVYVAPIKNYFNMNASKNDLVATWKIACIMHRRDPSAEGNVKLSGSKGNDWPWDAFVTVGEEGDSPEAVGEHIAETLSSFSKIKGSGFNYKQEFSFRRVASDGDDLKPLTYYLLDEHVVLIFKHMFASENTKEKMMEEDEILEDFFGTAERGRDLLIDEHWVVP